MHPIPRRRSRAILPPRRQGCPGVETMIPLLLPKVLSGEITLASLIAKTSTNPCSILGIPAPGFSPGNRADFALYPREVTTVQAENLHSRCGWTPFEGREAVFPAMVILPAEGLSRSGDFIQG